MNILEMRRRTLGKGVYKKTAEGSTIVARSLARMRPGLKIMGKSTQKTTTGAQLIPFEVGKEIVSNGGKVKCVPQEDGFHITIESTPGTGATDDIYFKGSGGNYEEYENLPPGTYYCDVNDDKFMLFVVVWRNGQSVIIGQSDNNAKRLFTVQEGDKFRIFIRPSSNATSGVVQAIICKPDSVVDFASVAPETYKENGVTVTNNKDGSFTVTGTPTKESGYIFTFWYIQGVILKDGEYFLSNSLSAQINKKDGTAEWAAGKLTFNSEIDENIHLYFQRSAEAYKDGETVWPTIIDSSFVPTWEIYTGGKPSPSPDYPQEIEIAGKDKGNIEVSVLGGNLLNAKSESSVDISVEVKGDVITVTSKSDINIYRSVAIDQIELPAGDYYFECEFQDYDFADIGNRIEIRDVSKNIGITGLYENLAKRTFTLTETTQVKVVVYNGYKEIGKTYKIKGLTLSLDKDIPWETFKKPQTLIVLTPNGLPGIPVPSGGNYTDENGQQWICDEIDFRRGKYVQRVKKRYITSSDGIVFETPAGMNYTRFRIGVDDTFGTLPNKRHSVLSNIAKSADGLANTNNDNQIFQYGAAVYVYLTYKFPTVEDFKSWLDIDGNEFYVYGTLATPIETDLTPEQMQQYVSIHTNRPTTTVVNDAGCHMSLTYKTKKSLEVTE